MSADAIALRVATSFRQGEGPTALLDVVVDDVGEGWARISVVLKPAMLNGNGNAHGGMLFLLADTVFASACNSHNVATVAQACSITFLSPGTVGECISAYATESALLSRSGVYDVRLTGADGRTVALFQGISRALGRPALPDHQGDL